MGLFLKISGNEWSNETRDKRELSVYRECGHEVLVLAKGNPKDKGRLDKEEDYIVLRYSTRPLGEKVPNPINRFFSVFQWARFVQIVKPDYISGHDLIPSLLIAWLSTWFQKEKPQLIYDSHEFELGRNTKRNYFQMIVIKHLEKFLMGRCAFSIMVNDSIADEVQRIHKLKKRPIVIRNTTNYWNLNEKTCSEQRKKFVYEFSKMGEKATFLIMYHGALTTGRGIEEMLRAQSQISSVHSIILGDGEEKYVLYLKEMVKHLEIENKVLFYPAVPIEELKNYIGAVDVGMIVIPPIVESYYFGLPNKFFENIQGETPVIVSELPEMVALTRKYGIGLETNSQDIEHIASCIKKMKDDCSFYQQCKINLKSAKKELCWEKEKNVLIEAIRHIT